MSLTFANKYTHPVSICIAWYNTGCADPPFRKTGWWNLAVGESRTVLSGNLNNRYYYFHGESANGAVWGDSSQQMSVVNLAFDRCFSDIFEPSRIVGLNTIDTGPYTNFVVNLVP